MKPLLLILLALVLALLAAGLIGRRLPRTHRAAGRIRLKAPPEAVWTIITDFEGYPTWRPGLKCVERGPDFDGLPSWYEICSRHGRAHFRVTESEPPQRLVTRLADDALPVSGRWVFDLQPDGDGTVLTITEWEDIHHPLLRFLERYVLSYYGVIDVYLVALAARLGQPAAPEHLSLKLDHDLPAA
jgi:hypothetical protein